MIIREAIEVLNNTAWLGTEKDLQDVTQAIGLLGDAAIASDVAVKAMEETQQAYTQGYEDGRQALYKETCELMGKS